MFTGLIEEVGRVTSARRLGGSVQLTIDAPAIARQLRVGASICVNGACQTVIRKRGRAFTVEAVEETLRKTTLGELRSSSRVNLELPLRLSDRLGGHLVQGHVDCVGSIAAVEKRESSWLVEVEFPREFARYVVPVGSIAVDGISLTVAAVEEARFAVSVIPHTLEKTTLSAARPGRRVNLEFDLVGKYVARLAGEGQAPTGSPVKEREGLSVARLREWGYG